MGESAIDKEFQEQVRDYVQPGTSALFMIIEQVTPDKATEALSQYGGTVIKTSLSDEDTKKLQEALTPAEPRRPPPDVLNRASAREIRGAHPRPGRRQQRLRPEVGEPDEREVEPALEADVARPPLRKELAVEAE